MYLKLIQFIALKFLNFEVFVKKIPDFSDKYIWIRKIVLNDKMATLGYCGFEKYIKFL